MKKFKRFELIQGDCLEKLKEMPSESVDLILTDPPYSINYESAYRKPKRKFDTSWDRDFTFKPFFHELLRVLKNDSVLLVFGSFKTLQDYVLQNLPRPTSVLIWDKNNAGMGDLNWFSPSYEIILVFVKGKKPVLNSLSRPSSILKFNNSKNSSFELKNGYRGSRIRTGDMCQDFLLHPTQKPVALLEHLINLCSVENQVVLDAFMGSGSTGVACLRLNRRFIGIELNEDYFKVAEHRINNTSLQKKLV